ncbi:MAG TPA: helix-turn-helix transcriptional regulator [bacterium]|nr:helix-turn-helix transcriptional regulator [bacterium]
MSFALHRERLIGDVLRTTFEAATFKDLDIETLPLIDRLCDTSVSMIYRTNEKGELINIGGDRETHNGYVERYRHSDPMQNALCREDVRILRGPRCPEWKKFLELPVYHEHAKLHGIDNYIVFRLTESKIFEPGSVGIILARSRRQPDFSEGEEHLLARILPSLEAMVRRISRSEARFETQALLETILDLDSPAKIACDLQGRLLWASESAAGWLGLSHRKHALPELLAEAARRVGALCRQGRPTEPPIPQVRLVGENQASVLVELRLARTRNGSPFVLAELRVPKVSLELADAAARFHLTLAETHVLEALARGLSDLLISRELFISRATVRTHVGRILAKLGVASRTQAALLAHGLPH